MVSRPHALTESLSTLSTAELSAWLGDYLRGSVPAAGWPAKSYQDRQSYLLDACRPLEPGPARRFGDAAAVALLAAVPSAGRRPAPAVVTGLLRLVELLPTSAPDQTVDHLDRLRGRAELRGWPSPGGDIHRGVLLALASQLRDAAPDPDGWHRRLAPDLADPAYANSALIALANQSLPLAVRLLPGVFDLVESDSLDGDLLAFFFAEELSQRPAEEVAGLLAGMDRPDVAATISDWTRRLASVVAADESAALLVSPGAGKAVSIPD